MESRFDRGGYRYRKDCINSKKEDEQTIILGARNCGIVTAVNEAIAKIVEDKLRSGNFPLLLGGDHSISLGSMAGVLRVRPDTGVLWIDAHADLNIPDVSDLGNMHGMPVGLLLDTNTPKQQLSKTMNWLDDQPRLKPDSIVYVGLRDVDMAERQMLRDYIIKAYTMHDIDRYDVGTVLDKALEHLLSKDPHHPLHLSYDIDAIDPALAPATGTTVRGGLTYREAHYIAEAVALSEIWHRPISWNSIRR